MKICLTIVFNHKFENNVHKLNKLYKNRFDNIYYLMPFYTGNNKNVIPIYENPHTFQGYFIQSLTHYYNIKYSHYLFMADDLILNPKVNQNNIYKLLRLKSDSAYFKAAFSLHNIDFPWPHVLPAINIFQTNTGINVQNEIPDYHHAYKRISSHNINLNDQKMRFRTKWLLLSRNMKNIEKVKLFLFSIYKFRLNFFRVQKLPYPLVGGYSDFVIVPASSIKLFCHYCGVFASMGLFVEVALPTALLLACNNIVWERGDFEGLEIWDLQQLENISHECDFNIKKLFLNYHHKLYIHPAKLSKWTVE